MSAGNVKDPQMQAQIVETVVQKDLDLDSTVQLVKGIQATDQIYDKAEEIQSTKKPAPKPRTADLTFTIGARGEIVLGPDTRLVVRDSENIAIGISPTNFARHGSSFGKGMWLSSHSDILQAFTP